MTQRELELFMEGQEEHWRRVRELLAWTQANVMGAVVGAAGGKSRVKSENLLPKSDVAKRKKNEAKHEQPASLMSMDPKDVRSFFSERRTQKDEAAWLNTPEAKRLHAFEKSMGYGPEVEEGEPEE